MGKKMLRRAEREAKKHQQPPPWKLPQQKRRDSPPLLDGVASVAILRFTDDGEILVLGVQDNDGRKARERNGAKQNPVVLPGGRRKHVEGTGREEPIHVTAQKEGIEEIGVKIPLTELLPLSVAHRIGAGKTGRDAFDRELKEGEEIQYPHIVFACMGDAIEPGEIKGKETSNPRWDSFWDDVLVSPEKTAWSFDHVTLLTYALHSLGKLYVEWVWEGWKQNTLPNESLGTLFFQKLAASLQKSAEVSRALEHLARIDFLDSVAMRMTHITEITVSKEKERLKTLSAVYGWTTPLPDLTADGMRKTAAEWYLGNRRDKVKPGQKKGKFMPDSFHPLGDTKTYFEMLDALKEEERRTATNTPSRI